MHHPAWTLILFILCMPAVIGVSIERYEAVFDMQEDVAVTVTIVLNESVSEELVFGMPRDFRELSLKIDGQRRETLVEGNAVVIPLSDNSRITLAYRTDFYVDGDDFLYDFMPAFDIEQLVLLVVIPEKAQLEESLNDGGSIYPRPTRALTDGKRMTFIWEREGVHEGDELALYAKLERDSHGFVAGVALAITVLVSGVVYLIVRRRPSAHIDKHLKEDEQIIINVLKQREGRKIEQGTLRVVTGFSKASLSRLLSELEARNVVHKEKRGKKNVVWLKG
jgi:uncharacterized membrane protein